MINDIKYIIQDSIEIKNKIIENDEICSHLVDLVEQTIECYKNGGKVIFAGNGGSFADAQHLSAEFVSRFMFDRPALPSVVLAANNSAISAIGNDYGYEEIFARELGVIASKGDIFIPISTSGNSPNILKAINVGFDFGLDIVGFTGDNGGEMGKIIRCIKIPSDNTARIQESHITIGHILCELVERSIYAQSM